MLSTVEAYDPDTDTWTSKAPMLNARRGLGAAAVGDRIYAIGGCNALDNPSGKVEEYTPLTDTWKTKASMPTAR